MAKDNQSKSLQLETQRIYSYWQALLCSFFSSLLYWDVYKRWKGIGVLYLLLMVCIFSIPYAVKTIINIRQMFDVQIIQPFERLPDIPYVSGKLEFDKKMPYLIKNKKGEVETIIDKTGRYTKFDNKKYPSLRFLFVDGKVMYTMPDMSHYFSDPDEVKHSDVRDIKVPKDISFVFNGKMFIKEFQVQRLKMLTLTMIYPVIAFTFYAIAIVFLFPFAMMGQLVSQLFFKVQLYYKQSCRLLCVASTPAFIVLQYMAITNYDQRYIGYAWIAMMAVYFSFACLILKRNLRSIARL